MSNGTDFVGYRLTPLRGSTPVTFLFDKVLGKGGYAPVQTKYTNGRTELKGFAPSPMIYYAGDLNYREFDLAGLFVGDDVLSDGYEEFLEFKRWIDKRVAWKVENSRGETIVCDVQLISDLSPQNFDEQNGFVSVEVRCTEIDDRRRQ